jgi:peptidylprolyl isomerase
LHKQRRISKPTSASRQKGDWVKPDNGSKRSSRNSNGYSSRVKNNVSMTQLPIMRTLIAMFLSTLALGSTAAAQNSLPAPSDVAAPPVTATKTASGLVSRVITPGNGNTHPGKSDLVTVHYTGWTPDGKMFDSTRTRGKAATFPLDRVIAGWTEGVQLMVEGETRRFWIPEALAYQGQRDPKGTLVFDVELLSFLAPPTAPSDVKAVPSDAKHTPSGLAYKALTPGTGTRHPNQHSEVTVHYSGWTTDGKMFDSSVMRGEPATFPLDAVIPGWTEGVQLMVEGETMRFWIPENLAYKGQSAPYGMLVFDVKLISIK